MAVRPRVAIVGAGVVGLSVGVCLSESLQPLDLTVIADRFSPHTTSDRAGAIFVHGGNYIPGGGQSFEDNATKWTKATFKWYTHITEKYGEQTTGVHLMQAYRVYKGAQSSDGQEFVTKDFKELSQSEAKEQNLPFDKFQTFWSFKTFITNGSVYLPWLMERIREKGGLIIHQKVENLSELQHYDVVINCTGLGAKELVGDSEMFPVRGQLVIVKAPKIKAAFHHREHDNLTEIEYVIPHKSHVLLGGTSEVDNWSTIPDPQVTQKIFKNCLRYVPDLQGAEIIGSYACLRPVRGEVRLEIERPVVDGKPAIVHNYGHGGHGVSTHWGCAVECVELVLKCLQDKGLVLAKL